MINKLNYTVARASKKTGISKGTLYKMFEKKDIDSRLLLELGKALGYDFAEDLPELRSEEYKAHRLGSKEEEEKHYSEQTAILMHEEAAISAAREEQQRMLAFISRLIKEHGLAHEGEDLINLLASFEEDSPLSLPSL